MDGLIVFLARDLVWVVLAFTLVLVGLDLWKGAKSHHGSTMKRIKSANWRKLGFILLAFLLAFLLAQILHIIPVEIYRPFQILRVQPLIVPSIDTPFPSDYVLLAFALAFAAIFMTKYKKIGLIGLVLAFGVLFGRILALVHTPLDVIGGIACAGVGALVWYYLYYRETTKNLPGDLRKLWATIGKQSGRIWVVASGKVKEVIRRVRK